MNFMNRYCSKNFPKSMKGGYKYIFGTSTMFSNIKYAVNALSFHFWLSKIKKFNLNLIL
jgi:hypothetical protein